MTNTTISEVQGKDLTLDTWVSTFERIYYFSQNHERSPLQILGRLYETLLNLQKSAIKAREYNECRTKWLPKLFAWYCGLVRSLELGNVSALIWNKFPGICPFCNQTVCNCSGVIKKELNSSMLAELASAGRSRQPVTIANWQALFDRIYSQRQKGIAGLYGGEGNPTPDRLIAYAFLKTYEELTELSEAIRLRPFYPNNVKNEIADVFACICGLANLLPNLGDPNEVLDLGKEVWTRYPDVCDTCKNKICNCRYHAVQQRLSAAGVVDFQRKDDLTGLSNRGQYDIDRGLIFESPIDIIVAEMFFDCDDFKSFNAKPGEHLQGDEVLKQIAKVAEKAAAPYTVYRYGGDEFSVLLRGKTREEIAKTCSSILRELLCIKAQDIFDDSIFYPVSVSAGLAYRSTSTQTCLDLTSAAQTAQRLAKENGKGRIITAAD